MRRVEWVDTTVKPYYEDGAVCGRMSPCSQGKNGWRATGHASGAIRLPTCRAVLVPASSNPPSTSPSVRGGENIIMRGKATR